MEHINFFLFCTTALTLILTPGPDIIYIATRGMAQGRTVGLVSTLGVCAGYIVHTGFAMLGLSALLQTSEFLFNFVRFAGAAYLFYLGIQMWLSNQHNKKSKTMATPVVHRKLFWTGLITSVTNPKGILFFFAFLPQFIVPSAGQVPFQMFVLGLAFTFMCLMVYGLVALFAGKLGDSISGTPRFANFMQRVTGSVLIALGIRLLAPEYK
jgi:threonine/homoserine/homoserine lactone efflux protein